MVTSYIFPSFEMVKCTDVLEVSDASSFRAEVSRPYSHKLSNSLYHSNAAKNAGSYYETSVIVNFTIYNRCNTPKSSPPESDYAYSTLLCPSTVNLALSAPRIEMGPIKPKACLPSWNHFAFTSGRLNKVSNVTNLVTVRYHLQVTFKSV
jgi:hypothetical protein